MSSKFFNHTILGFQYQTLWQYSDGDALTEAKNAIFDQYLSSGSMIVVVLSVVKSFDRGRNATRQ